MTKPLHPVAKMFDDSDVGDEHRPGTGILHKTREQYLHAASREIERVFLRPRGLALPDRYAVSCGFPKGGHGGRDVAIGQCWSPEVSQGRVHEVFISPALAGANEVLATLLHEIVHAVVGISQGHKGKFRTLARECGLRGKLTATYVPEATICGGLLARMSDRLGTYPHRALVPVRRVGKGGSGWVRYRSVNIEGYAVVVSPRMVEEHGAPLDPQGEEMEAAS